MTTFTEPITTAEIMAHCRIMSATTDEQAYLEALSGAAREYAEGYTGVLYGVRDVTEDFEQVSDNYSLKSGPVTSLVSVTVSTESGDVDITDSYILDVKNNALIMTEQPDVTPKGLYPVHVTYTAGSQMPKIIRQACLLIIGHWYENREEVVVGSGGASQIPMGAIRLLDMKRHAFI